MDKDWAAAATTDGVGSPVIALRVTDGAIIYLHPEIARQFAHQIRVALGDVKQR